MGTAVNATVVCGDRFLRCREVCNKIAIEKSKLYDMVARGFFPEGVKLGAKTTVWLNSAVEKWMQHVVDTGGIHEGWSCHEC